MDKLKTKTTYLGNGLYGCRVLDSHTGTPVVELQVEKSLISDAYFDMLRTLDKLGSGSDMANASRHRGKGKCVSAKYIWH